MAKGSSGRIVIEIDPSFKGELYMELEKEGLKMKEWFIANAEDFMKDRSQLSLKLLSEDEQSLSGVRRG